MEKVARESSDRKDIPVLIITGKTPSADFEMTKKLTLWSVYRRHTMRDAFLCDMPHMATLWLAFCHSAIGQISIGSQRLPALAAARPQMWQMHFASFDSVAT